MNNKQHFLKVLTTVADKLNRLLNLNKSSLFLNEEDRLDWENDLEKAIDNIIDLIDFIN